MSAPVTLFSANLGFLWKDLPLPDAIASAKAAGFDAVECHWPYDTPSADVKAALNEAGLVMLGLNTKRGDVAAGDMGLAAVPGREVEARRGIVEAIDYAVAIGARNVHVLAGCASGCEAHTAFVSNLAYACERARVDNITILIEPLNHFDVPGYFLSTTAQAASIIEQVGQANLKLMFDCYHVQLMEGDLRNRLRQLQPIIGHIQFASVPGRGAPDHGEVNYADVFKLLRSLGYDAPLGAEYNPVGKTEDTLGWMKALVR